MTASTRLVNDKIEFCVVGHSRSGTGYMGALFGCLGYRIGHERVEKHGISSWLWAANTRIVPFGNPREDKEIRHLIQVVRNPWRVISSVITAKAMDRRVIDFMREFVYIDMTADHSAQAAYMVIGWNRLIQAQAPELTVQVERVAEVLPGWLKKHRYRIPEKYPLPPNDYNTSLQSRELDLELLREWPRGLLREFREHYQRYKYPVPELLGRLAG